MGTTVCLSFDIDAYGPTLFHREQNAAVLSQGEFDTQVAVPRLLTLLADYGIRATFFIPGHTADCFPRMVEAVREAGHEIGHHGYLHEPPQRLSAEAEAEALAKGIESLRRITGEAPAGYRSPLWEPSTRTIGLLADSGFRFDSSLMGTDFSPYYARRDDVITAAGATFGPPTPIVELPSSWIFDDWGYFANVSADAAGSATPPSHVLEIWTEQVSFAAESVSDSVVVMTMHPQVSGQGYVLRMLRRFLDWLAADARLSLAAMGQTAEAWRTRQGGNQP